jgi:hypothetical protein
VDTDYSVEIAASRKIAEARRAAAYDRLAVVAAQARHDAGPGARSWLAGLFRALANVFGRGRSALETTVPAGHAR